MSPVSCIAKSQETMVFAYLLRQELCEIAFLEQWQPFAQVVAAFDAVVVVVRTAEEGARGHGLKESGKARRAVI